MSSLVMVKGKWQLRLTAAFGPVTVSRQLTTIMDEKSQKTEAPETPEAPPTGIPRNSLGAIMSRLSPQSLVSAMHLHPACSLNLSVRSGPSPSSVPSSSSLHFRAEDDRTRITFRRSLIPSQRSKDIVQRQYQSPNPNSTSGKTL